MIAHWLPCELVHFIRRVVPLLLATVCRFESDASFADSIDRHVHQPFISEVCVFQFASAIVETA